MLRYMVMVLVLLIGLLPASAQAVEVDLGGGYSVVLPKGWEEADSDVSPVFEVSVPVSSVLLTNDDIVYVQFVSPHDLRTVFEESEDLALGDALLLAIAALYNNDLTGLGAEEVGVKDADLEVYEAVFFEQIMQTEGAEYSRRIYLMRLDEAGSFLLADFYAEGRTIIPTVEKMVHILLESVVVSQTEASGEPCFVSTETARTATVRVGPGENRTALLFLPVGEDFAVTGRLVTDDESVWYQLDKTQVDPNTSAAELWVAQADVEEVGDCDLVGETAAPPIRPIISAPPAGGGGESGTTPPAGGTIPQSGTWTIVLADRGLVSCLGTNTLEFNTNEVFITLVLSDTLTVASDGTSFTYFEFTFTQIGPGAYSGAIPLDGVGSGYGVKLYVQNTSFMGGELVYNENVQGQQCSFTIPLSASRN